MFIRTSLQLAVNAYFLCLSMVKRHWLLLALLVLAQILFSNLMLPYLMYDLIGSSMVGPGQEPSSSSLPAAILSWKGLAIFASLIICGLILFTVIRKTLAYQFQRAALQGCSPVTSPLMARYLLFYLLTISLSSLPRYIIVTDLVSLGSLVYLGSLALWPLYIAVFFTDTILAAGQGGLWAAITGSVKLVRHHWLALLFVAAPPYLVLKLAENLAAIFVNHTIALSITNIGMAALYIIAAAVLEASLYAALIDRDQQNQRQLADIFS